MIVGEKQYCPGCMRELSSPQAGCECGFDETKYQGKSYFLPPGFILKDKFLVGKVLGEGGFGITYIGLDLLLDRRVAIKEFFMTDYVNRSTSESSEVISVGNAAEVFEKNRDKFINEARNLAKFEGESGIVSVYEYFKENNTAYIIMEYLDGEDLESYLKHRRKLEVEEVVSIFLPVMNVLEKVHNNHLIHRDISPDNIRISSGNKITLLDFGAARANAGETSELKTKTVILKHGYAPIEQYQQHGKQGPWTDIYALCATMFTCLTGVRPDASTDRLDSEEDSLAVLEENCKNSAVCKIIRKGMNIKRSERYQTIAELRDVLLAAMQEKPEKDALELAEPAKLQVPVQPSLIQQEPVQKALVQPVQDQNTPKASDHKADAPGNKPDDFSHKVNHSDKGVVASRQNNAGAPKIEENTFREPEDLQKGNRAENRNPENSVKKLNEPVRLDAAPSVRHGFGFINDFETPDGNGFYHADSGVRKNPSAAPDRMRDALQDRYEEERRKATEKRIAKKPPEESEKVKELKRTSALRARKLHDEEVAKRAKAEREQLEKKRQRWLNLAYMGLLCSAASMLLPIITYRMDGKDYSFNLIQLFTKQDDFNRYVLNTYTGKVIWDISYSTVVVLVLVTLVAFLLAFNGIRTLKIQYSNEKQIVMTVIGLVGISIPSFTIMLAVWVYGSDFYGIINLGLAPVLSPVALLISLIAVLVQRNNKALDLQKEVMDEGLIRPAGDL